ncbi:MAG TPA: hypothetical protein VFN10_07160 [Thermoanaerobaculia bacterium]|nr:hypothetical protein [Thermoanaerobaculia bacterium]
MTRAALIVAFALSTALTAHAQQENISHSVVDCIRGGQSPVLNVGISGKGELRAYFRRVNTTDWCSVRGDNMGQMSHVVLPKFENGDYIEYFFVLLDGKRVTGRSPQMYRAHVTEACASPFARHLTIMYMECSDNAPGNIPSSIASGLSIDEKLVTNPGPFGSPDRPDQTEARKP